MSSEGGRYPPNRIPQGVEAATQLIKGRDTMDIVLLVMIPAGLMGMLFYANILTPLGFAVSFVIILALNYGIFSLIPEQESVLYWLRSLGAYSKTDKDVFKSDVENSAIDMNANVDTESTGGRDPTESRKLELIEASETTKDFAEIESIDTENGLVELIGGGFAAGIHVTGMERILSNEDLNRKAEQQLKNFINTTDFDFTIRCTSVQFDIDSEIEHYEERLEDEDVSNRPIFERHLRSKKAFMQQEIKGLGMNNRKYYVIVKALPEDQSLGDGGPFNIDFIDPNSPVGKWLRKNASGKETKSQEENLADMAMKRRKSTQRGLAKIKQLSTSPMEGNELAYYMHNQWTNDDISFDNWKPSIAVSVSENQVKEGSYDV